MIRCNVSGLMGGSSVMASKARSFLSMYRTIAIVTINTAILIAIMEILSSIFEGTKPPATLLLSYDYAPYRMMKHNRAPWPINSDGFRAQPLELYRRSDPEQFRIVFLGSSVCMGFGLDNGKPLPDLLQEELQGRGHTKVEVVNLCQGGAVSAQELAILIEYGFPLQPALIISFNGANDVLHPKSIGSDAKPNLPYLNDQLRALWIDSESQHFLSAIITQTSLGRRFSRWARKDDATKPDENVSVPMEDIVNSYMYIMDLTRKLTRAYSVNHMIFLQPTLLVDKPQSEEEEAMIKRYHSDYQGTLSRTRQIYSLLSTRLPSWAAKNNVDVYDLTSAFRDVKDTVYMDSVHFGNLKGYPTLLEKLKAQGLLEKIAEQYKLWEGNRKTRSNHTQNVPLLPSKSTSGAREIEY